MSWRRRRRTITAQQLKDVGSVADPNTRFRILSLWLPLTDYVKTFPLGMYSEQTIAEEHIRPADVRLALKQTHENHHLYSFIHQTWNNLLFLELWNCAYLLALLVNG